jgi:hypothetical protein
MSGSEVSDNFTLTMNNSNAGGPPEYYYYYSFNYVEFFKGFRFQLDIFLWKYFSLVITILAFFANLIVAAVLLQKKSRNFSTSIFITNLAIADMFVCLSPFEGFLLMHRIVDETYSDFDCKFRMFIPKVTYYVSVWMLVFISIERALSVKLPLKVKTIFTLRSSRILVIIVWVLAIAKVSLNVSFVAMQANIAGILGCFMTLSTTPTLYYIDLVLYSCFAILIPYPIILVCTVITISSLLQNKIRKSKSNKTQVKSITITLVIINIVYLVSVAPGVVYEIYTIFWMRLGGFVEWTFVEYYNYIALLNIFTFMEYLHHALNFFIYFLNGSRFREETIDLLFFCFRKKSGKDMHSKK